MTPKRMLRNVPFLATALLAALAAAGQGPTPRGPGEAEGEPPRPLGIPGLENAFRLSPRLYSGGEPRGKASLEALRDLGVRTIISVDGTDPEVEAARELGMRYVHLPIGYDGVPRDQAVRMVKAVETLPGPVYVHCHHGIHRGPASAAICGIATEGWSRERAAGWLRVAGTSPDYRGLHGSVRDFVPPTAKELEGVAGELPERSAVPDLVAMMVKIDERWDGLKAVRKAGFRPPPAHPEVDPAAEALQLLELYREALRLPEVQDKGGAFLREMASAEGAASRLYEAMAGHGRKPPSGPLDAREAAFAAAEKSCKSCHARYRDD